MYWHADRAKNSFDLTNLWPRIHLCVDRPSASATCEAMSRVLVWIESSLLKVPTYTKCMWLVLSRFPEFFSTSYNTQKSCIGKLYCCFSRSLQPGVNKAEKFDNVSCNLLDIAIFKKSSTNTAFQLFYKSRSIFVLGIDCNLLFTKVVITWTYMHFWVCILPLFQKRTKCDFKLLTVC